MAPDTTEQTTEQPIETKEVPPTSPDMSADMSSGETTTPAPIPTPTPDTTPETTDTTPETSDIKVGYFVALKKDGEISFEILGQEVGIIELMGLHEMAGLRILEPMETSKFQQIHQALGLVLQLLQNRKTAIGNNNPQSSIILPK